MAWKAIRYLLGYRMGLCTSNGKVIENPGNVVDSSPIIFGNTPVSKSSLPASTGELWFNITNNLAINFCFNYVGDSSFDSNTAHCWIYLNSQTNPGYWYGAFGCGGNYTRYTDILAFIDDENQKACFVWRLHYKYRWGQPGALYDNDSALRSNSTYDSAIYAALKPSMVDTTNGGGASHIAKVTGQLSTLSSNLSDILIVSGGGGGGMLIGTTGYDGKDAGGISGSGSNSGNQNGGYAFGQGQSSTTTSGGGSGLYGGYKGTEAVADQYDFNATYKIGSYTCGNSSIPSTIKQLINTNKGTNNYQGQIAKTDISPEPQYSEDIITYCGSYPMRGGKYPGGGNQISPDPREIMPQTIGNGSIWFGYPATDSIHTEGGIYLYDSNNNLVVKCPLRLGDSSWGYWAGFWGFIIPNHKLRHAILLTFSYVASDKWYWQSTEGTSADSIAKKEAVYSLVFGSTNGGGAGSGYIGNSSLVSYTAQKKMVGYNVPTSNAGTTKTESVNTYDVNPEPNTPKINNGHIRIKYIREEIIPSYLSEVGTYLIGREDNKQSLLTCPKWQNGMYFNTGQWILPMSLYHPNTNINSDDINLASFPDGATVNIDTTNGINVTYIGFTATRQFSMYGTMRSRAGLQWESGSGTPKGAYFYGLQSGNDSQYAPTKNDFTSLDQLFEYIYNHFRHCNVVLNGTTIVSETSE